MTVTLLDEMKTALQEKDMTIRSLRKRVDKLEASAKTNPKVKKMCWNTEH